MDQSANDAKMLEGAKEEFRLLQQGRARTKRVNIGAATTTLLLGTTFSKVHKGNIVIASDAIGSIVIPCNQIRNIYDNGLDRLLLSCNLIVSYTVHNTTVNLKLDESYYITNCMIEFSYGEQVQRFLSNLGPLHEDYMKAVLAAKAKA